MTRILVVEDNPDLAFGLSINLEQDGYQAAIVDNGTDGIAAVLADEADLVILDLMLPDMTGFDVLTTLRNRGAVVPILVLSAKAEEIDKVTAFRLGANDYVTKPFGVLELLERIRARLRDSASGATTRIGLRVDVARREVTYDDRSVFITPLEFDLLTALVRADGAVLSRGELLKDVWKAPRDLNTRTVDFHIGSLRRKLNAAGITSAVRTVHGKGVAWSLGNCFV